MPAVVLPITTPDGKNPQIHAGNVVNIRLTSTGVAYIMTGEAYSPPISRGVTRTFTLWVEGVAPTDRFQLQMCYAPVFFDDGTFDVVSSSWSRIGNPVTLSATGGLVAAQTLNDMAYAIRVVRVNAAGNPTPGNFKVYVWGLHG